ncbi:MAG: efflux RND transporter periplasmic adaptor subunit [Pseudomonadales bacterium]|nr:efflux RND transporter periplasmic adaptor subunit [Pseudomonadales bacterium]
MKLQHLVALGLVALLVVWMLIPRERTSPSARFETPQTETSIRAVPEEATVGGDSSAYIVRIKSVTEQDFVERVRVRGITEAKRVVDIRAETSGRVVDTPIERGKRVKTGDLICQLAIDTREVDLQEAKSRLAQAELEYQGGLDLERRNLTSRTNVAQLKADLDAAIAAVERAELALKRTRIIAPFDGILETREVEVGALMDIGGTCARLLDDDPMLLTGFVSEENVARIELGSTATASLMTGETISGKVTYIARAADPASRSYRIEVEVSPGDVALRQGVTAEIFVTGRQIRAHMVTPSALTLDDNGLIGVKTVNRDNVVEFHEVKIVGENNGINPGTWVTGLPAQTDIITLGQEIVFPGQTVETSR